MRRAVPTSPAPHTRASIQFTAAELVALCKRLDGEPLDAHERQSAENAAAKIDNARRASRGRQAA